MADGYARVTGWPQAVIVHVDVGTQALGQGIHNASVGRVPVLIFAGMCPYTESGELPGSRTEYMHWLQEAPDQKAIVRQYCRYTGEVRTGLNVKQTIGRALQFAKSAPRGPAYVASAREVLAQEIQPYSLAQDQWVPIGPGALPADAVHDISTALVQAERPLIITGYSGRDRRTPDLLVALADLIPGIRVHDTGGSDVCFPSTHIASEGFRLSLDECTRETDMVFLLDCDVPWIPSRNPPPKDAKIYHVDSDPLNQQIPVSFFPAHGRWKADSCNALTQLVDHIRQDTSLATILQDPKYAIRREARAEAYRARLASIAAQSRLGNQETLDAHNIGSLLWAFLPDSTTFVVEAVTASQTLHDQLQPSRPGSWINCGGTGIGWSNGAAVGVKMALTDLEKEGHKPSLVCQIVGDGSFMCAAPSSALWVAGKYEIPILTIVLNNGGKPIFHARPLFGLLSLASMSINSSIPPRMESASKIHRTRLPRWSQHLGNRRGDQYLVPSNAQLCCSGRGSDRIGTWLDEHFREPEGMDEGDAGQDGGEPQGGASAGHFEGGRGGTRHAA